MCMSRGIGTPPQRTVRIRWAYCSRTKPTNTNGSGSSGAQQGATQRQGAENEGAISDGQTQNVNLGLHSRQPTSADEAPDNSRKWILGKKEVLGAVLRSQL